MVDVPIQRLPAERQVPRHFAEARAGAVEASEQAKRASFQMLSGLGSSRSSQGFAPGEPEKAIKRARPNR